MKIRKYSITSLSNFEAYKNDIIIKNLKSKDKIVIEIEGLKSGDKIVIAWEGGSQKFKIK